ncbi:MAG: ABC transporter substrate-binding protein [Treponema sp.]|jgi:NitT/TauT family transport system substrate-binding protein|nr:ABC transporter substrate-binding protein [Treponema sp.]
MKKIVSALGFALALACPLWARPQAEDPKAPVPLVINAIRGPSGVGMIGLFENPPEIPGYDVSIEAAGQADIIAAKFISGEAKVGVLPPNVAAKIASSGKNIQIAAIVGAGMMSLISGDPSVQGIGDLKGKTVEAAGQGATPEYVFRHILKARGIDPDRDLRLTFTLAYPEIAQSLIAGRLGLALLVEPFATMALRGNPALRQVGDIQEEWALSGGNSNYPMTALVVDGDFARENRNAVGVILAAYKNSTEWVVAHPAEAGRLVEKFELGLRAPVVEAAVPRSNYVFQSAREARPAIESLFRVFLENDPASIGGKLPESGFYYEE